MTINWIHRLATVIFFSCILANTQELSLADKPEKEIVGLKITGFLENSSLQSAGAKVDDIVTHYDGVKLLSMAHLVELRDKVEKDTVEMVLKRGDETMTMHVPKGLLGAYMREVVPEHAVDSDAIIIAGIGHLGWGIGMENSFLGCVTLLEERYGMKLSYADILGLSGYGFRLHFFKGFCPSSPDATCGRDLGSEILTMLGYEFKILSVPDSAKSSKDEIDRVREQIMENVKASIKQGWPVIAIDLIDIAEWGMITGYQKNGDELFCRTYYDETEGYEIARKFPGVVFCITGKKKINIKDKYKKSLLTAKELYNTKEYGSYANGINGLKTWKKTLLDDKFYAEMDEKKLSETMHANWWIYYNLADAREINRLYLESNIRKFGIDTVTVKNLAVLMGKESELLKKGFENVPSRWQNKDASVWTPAVRKEQAVVLADFLKLEEHVNQILKKIK